MTASHHLLVFAHRDEAVAFADVPHVVTGVGKVNAATSLAKLLATGDVAGVTVLGTAGLVSDDQDRQELDEIAQITAVMQHDFSLPSPTLESAGPRLLDRTVTIATGDVFVKNDRQRAAIRALGADLVDMESYAYASVCEVFGVPLQIFKIVSDFADSGTTDEDWDRIVAHKSRLLREFWDSALR